MATTLHQRLLAALAVLLVAGCDPHSPETTGPSLGRATPAASFDWTMPARFGFDRDGDGLVDYPRTAEEIHPTSWTVELDACDLPGSRYTWYVDARPVATVTSCTYTHQFPAEGTYDVALHVVSTPGSSVWAEQPVTVQDWLIVSFGDSYASGEGVPEVPLANADLVASIMALLNDVREAQEHLAAAQSALADAFESKGLAADILATAQQRHQEFLNACSDIDSWSDVQTCKDFLVARALSFELYNQAAAHFEQAVVNAQERLDDLTDAYNEAVAAFESAQSAVTNLAGALAAASAGFTPPRWQAPYANEPWAENFSCHRSANAAPARAALALEEADPRTSVTFLHLACSGARIDTSGGRLLQQIPAANELVGDREIDAVLLSIGGNDAGFASLAVACSAQEPCSVDEPGFDPNSWSAVCTLMSFVGLGDPCNAVLDFLPDTSAKGLLEIGLASLPSRYTMLADTLFPQLGGLLAPPVGGPGLDGRGHREPALSALDRLRSDRIYITEYVDMTKDDASQYCEFDSTDPLGVMPGFSVGEMGWLDGTAGQGINQAVQNAADAHGWTFVTGIYSSYAAHGYCATEHWVVRAPETFLTQGDHQGIAHPNVSGHSVNGAAIAATLESDLYPLGLDAPPRAPDQPRTPVQTASAKN